MRSGTVAPVGSLKKHNRFSAFCRALVQQKWLIFLTLPGFILILVFNYFPIYGILIAFKKFNPSLGIAGSPWRDPLFYNFQRFFSNPIWFRLFRNTLLLGVYSLIFSFITPIMLAMLLNEISHSAYKRIVQTISYIPHFISVVVIVGIMAEFVSLDGFVNDFRAFLGMSKIPLLGDPAYFRTLYVISSVWQGVGWGSIIYLAALAGVDPGLYEAATIDGAGRWSKMWHISFQSIKPTITIMLIMSTGSVLSTNIEKVYVMLRDSNRPVGEVIATYVYTEGVLGSRPEYGTAINLLVNVIAFALVITTNQVSKKVSENSLW
jgi:putative aldouronate transport system permease protein